MDNIMDLWQVKSDFSRNIFLKLTQHYSYSNKTTQSGVKILWAYFFQMCFYKIFSKYNLLLDYKYKKYTILF